jgi:hypothetical protein
MPADETTGFHSNAKNKRTAVKNKQHEISTKDYCNYIIVYWLMIFVLVEQDLNGKEVI